MGIGDWGLGIGDWGLGPIPNPHFSKYFTIKKNNYNIKNLILLKIKMIYLFDTIQYIFMKNVYINPKIIKSFF